MLPVVMRLFAGPSPCRMWAGAAEAVSDGVEGSGAVPAVAESGWPLSPDEDAAAEEPEEDAAVEDPEEDAAVEDPEEDAAPEAAPEAGAACAVPEECEEEDADGATQEGATRDGEASTAHAAVPQPASPASARPVTIILRLRISTSPSARATPGRREEWSPVPAREAFPPMPGTHGGEADARAAVRVRGGEPEGGASGQQPTPVQSSTPVSTITRGSV
ncbi:hypothetical protein [Actinoplanes sp. N902-109]|uniref:hypothetical protein n=1 Tax=Actinoplanes sp. (strain N902-109) TaxID=649831 RepID=UPI001E2CBA88|nr:hypothetical protein [Actinoplanes sp. N902-109]